MAKDPPVILASGSAARKRMMEAAGLSFDVVPADIDEEAIRASMMLDSGTVEAADVASVLSMEKALLVSRAHPNALVIGSDQVLVLGRRHFTKSATVAEARETLAALRGQTHELVSAVALAQGGEIVWQSFDSAQMTMRKFSDDYVASYLKSAGDAALKSVGCYEVEGFGVQLFEKIEGDYFTILGMPLLPLLTELRTRGVVMS
jgi:septum formation protein